MIRLIILWLLFVKYRITHRKISYKGFSIICSLSGGKIAIGGGTSLFSSFSSNMLGLYQRCIIVARHGGKIEIGDDCFIGMNSIILKGTKLGNNVIVGAGSVVHGSFPDNCIIAGNPAKIVKQM